MSDKVDIVITRREVTVKYRIKELREQKGLKQEDLARLTGIARSHLSLAETTDTANLTTKSLVTLATILECSVDDLILHESSEKSDNN